MNPEIHLHNQFFPWNNIEENNLKCWYKGDLFNNNKTIQRSEIVTIFSSLPTELKKYKEALEVLLHKFNGSYSLVIETPNNIICIVDRVRSIPLFYTTLKDSLIISDDANYIRDQINPTLNEKTCAEFLVTGYVTGSETVFEKIFQIQAGEYLIFTKNDKKIKTIIYHRFWHENYHSDSEKEMLEHLDKIFIQVFKRLIESTKNKGLQLVVPLSGGLDSRIIVAMLKRLDVDDVICFTYGRKETREVKISKRVAEALGYQHYFIEYTNKKWYDCVNAKLMKEYYIYSGNLVSCPHIQDFLAVKELKEIGKIPKNAVFIPGHTGDMLAGGHIPLEYSNSQVYNNEKFLHDILKMHYCLQKWNDKKELYSIFKERIQKPLLNIQINDEDQYANSIEFFDFNERQAKYIINSVRLYEYFGYSWRLPLWDIELIDFFLKCPLNYRLNRNLYKKYAYEKLFINDFKKLREIECTTKMEPKQTISMKIINEIKKRKNIYKCLHILQITKNKVTDYYYYPYAYYGLVSIENYLKFYSGEITTFIVLDYLKILLKSSINLSKIFKLK